MSLKSLLNATHNALELGKESLEGLMLTLKLQYFGHLIRTDSLEKPVFDAGKVEGRKGTTEDETVGWHH